MKATVTDACIAQGAKYGVKPCAAGHGHEVKTIGLFPVDGQTREQTYAQWCRKGGRNPWCGCVGCPEVPADG